MGSISFDSIPKAEKIKDETTSNAEEMKDETMFQVKASDLRQGRQGHVFHSLHADDWDWESKLNQS